MTYDAIIIGSGPAGVSAALACVKKGWKTLMLDEGKVLPPEYQLKVQQLVNKPEDEWIRSDLEFLHVSFESDFRKSTYGSRFPYAPDPETQKTNTGLERSWAKGGFSNAWGSVVLPYTVEQVQAWEIDVGEWQDAQNALVELLSISSDNCGWVRHFQISKSQARRDDLNPGPSPIIRKFLYKFEHSQRNKRNNNIAVGQALLAWRKNAGRCTGCQLCLVGCPYDLFYNARNSVDEMLHNGLHYRVGKVLRINQSENIFQIYCERQSEGQWDVKARRVFIGAGPLGTAEILLNSGFVNNSVKLKDSRWFLFPVLWSGRRFSEMNTIAAAQAFVEVYGATPADDVHFQIYDGSGPTFDHILTHRLKKIPAISIVWNFVKGRLIFVQGMLHSQVSGTIEVAHAELGVRVQGHDGAKSRWASAKAFLIFLRTFGPLGFLPLPVIKFPPLGLGQHVGASFPMKANPGPHETDLHGQWPRVPNLYIIDASSLPDIPPHTITFSIMTNAYRIANHAQ